MSIDLQEVPSPVRFDASGQESGVFVVVVILVFTSSSTEH
jgi:hypothetical protein